MTLPREVEAEEPRPAPVGSRAGGYFVIFNPTASRGSASRSRPHIEAALREAGAEFELVETQWHGHARELAGRAVAEGWGALIAVGGDGIVHEVVNGLIAAGGEGPTPPLGVVPLGSGNDFVKMLGTPPHQPALAIQRILNAEPRQVDVGRVTRYVGAGGPAGVWHFTNGVGVGFDAQVAQHASRIKRLRGVALYAWGIVKALRELRSPRMRVVVDGREIADRPLILTTISNGPCHAGSFWLCPGALVDDGELDILIADARPRPALIRLLPRVLKGKHLSAPGVQLLRGRRVTVRSEEPLAIHADGEVVAEWVQELEIEVLPGKLTVLA